MNKTFYGLNSLWMLNILFTVFLYVHVNVCNAQFTDNFSDGDFSQNPTWNGDIADFVVSSGRLKSNGPNLTSQKIYLQTASSRLDNTEWSFLIDLDFNPTATTFVRVYLSSDQSNLKGALNGYFIQIGQTNADFIKLFRQDGLNTTEIFSGSTSLGTGNILVRIRVRRSNTGNWSIDADATGGTNYASQGVVVIDNNYNLTSSFGVYCEYSTASRFNLYNFDDFYVGDIILDTMPPQVQSVKVLSSTQLEIQFDEKIESSSALTTSNYQVNNNVGQPSNVQIQTDQKTIVLTFSNSFTSPKESEVTLMNIKDVAGNVMVQTKFPFYYFDVVVPESKDVVITELFPDPNPVVGLPEAEFAEIYNRSAHAFNLLNWKITDGSSTGVLPSYVLKPGDYVILCATASASLFQSLGKTISISNFPTLNNASDNISLKSPSDNVIDQVNYTNEWYKDEDKKEGGWTLELIDPENICAEDENWVASENAKGGTPGNQNSVYANKPDLTGPRLLAVSVVSSTQLKLIFNEKLESQLPQLQSFSISPPISIQSVSFASASWRELTLVLSSSLQPSQLYEITTVSIYDCAGNIIQSDFNNGFFALSEVPTVGDVLINEILFNPKPYGVDFVELYNASNKFISLREMKIGNYDAETLTNEKVIAVDDQLFLPQQFLVLTTDPISLQAHYPQAVSKNMLKVKSLPSFPDDEGSVAISTSTHLLDYFNYRKEMHSSLLKDKEGVSLERISADHPTNDFQNWQSASSTSGFATPGLQNSSARGETIVTGSVQVVPEIFEPVTGQPNSTQVLYSFDRGGFVATIKVFDLQGREIKEIAKQVTLGTEGFFKWEGDRNDGTRASLGYYIVWVQVFDSTGSVQTFRKRVVISSRL